jgi:hypothetical protein
MLLKEGPRHVFYGNGCKYIECTPDVCQPLLNEVDVGVRAAIRWKGLRNTDWNDEDVGVLACMRE